MPRKTTWVALWALVYPISFCAAQDQQLAAMNKTLNELLRRARAAKTYSWSGEMTIGTQDAGGAWYAREKAEVQLALGENGKSLAKVKPMNGDEYWLISDGKKSWSYLPGKKKYTEEEAVSLNGDEGDSGDDEDPGADAPPTARTAWQAIPKMAKVLKDAQAIGVSKPVTLKLAEGKVTWPSVTIQDKPGESGARVLGELVIAPDRPVPGRLTWVNMPAQKSSQALRVDIQFNEFSLGEPLPDSLFAFDPPNKAKQVDELEMPGRTGWGLLNQKSPNFDARTQYGDKVSLADLRGKVVMLDFWASWCPPCRAELPTVAKLYGEYKDKNVVVLGVNDEGSGTARRYLEKAKLELPTLDDGSKKASRLYGVTAIPSVYVIGPDGKVVSYFRGGRSEEVLRTALKNAGAKD